VIPASFLLPRFEFEAPASVTVACELLAQADGEGRLMAGGTDLLVKMKRGALAPRLVISLSRIEELTRVDYAEGTLCLGACTTMARIAAAPEIVASWQALAEGAGWVGGPVIRNRATVGGNIINARPCADTLPPLIALGAKLRLQSSTGARTVELDGFMKGPGRCGIESGEVLTSIELPAPPLHSGSCYIKITRRAAMEVTIVGCAASVVLDAASERVTQARLVFTSVAPISLRIPSAESIVEGQAPTAQVLQAAAEEARRVAPAIGDHRAPQDYRSDVVAVIARRALKAAIERAGGTVQ
jgi:carbon-monoxide dehydrogenase medium subunit